MSCVSFSQPDGTFKLASVKKEKSTSKHVIRMYHVNVTILLSTKWLRSQVLKVPSGRLCASGQRLDGILDPDVPLALRLLFPLLLLLAGVEPLLDQGPLPGGPQGRRDAGGAGGEKIQPPGDAQVGKTIE